MLPSTHSSLLTLWNTITVILILHSECVFRRLSCIIVSTAIYLALTTWGLEFDMTSKHQQELWLLVMPGHPRICATPERSFLKTTVTQYRAHGSPQIIWCVKYSADAACLDILQSSHLQPYLQGFKVIEILNVPLQTFFSLCLQKVRAPF